MNRLELSARVLECEPLRHTPAGLPALELLLAHESEVIEAGLPRRVELTLQAVALGDLALMLKGIALGTELQVVGFLAPARGFGEGQAAFAAGAQDRRQCRARSAGGMTGQERGA